MKKLIAFILAVIMCFGLAATAFADVQGPIWEEWKPKERKYVVTNREGAAFCFESYDNTTQKKETKTTVIPYGKVVTKHIIIEKGAIVEWQWGEEINEDESKAEPYSLYDDALSYFKTGITEVMWKGKTGYVSDDDIFEIKIVPICIAAAFAVVLTAGIMIALIRKKKKTANSTIEN